MIVTYRLYTEFLNSTKIHSKSDQGNQCYSGDQKNAVQRQRPDMDNRHTTTLYSMICKKYHQTSFKTFNIYTHSCQRGYLVLPHSCYSHSGINSMWILKNSKDLLETLNSRLLSEYNSIIIYDFSTLYTFIPYTPLKYPLKSFTHCCFSKKRWYT